MNMIGMQRESRKVLCLKQNKNKYLIKIISSIFCQKETKKQKMNPQKNILIFFTFKKREKNERKWQIAKS